MSDVNDIGYGRQFADFYDRLYPPGELVDQAVAWLASLHPGGGLPSLELGVGTAGSPCRSPNASARSWASTPPRRCSTCCAPPSRLLASRTPIHGYEFTDRQAPRVTSRSPGFPSGAFHSSELAYLFDTGGFQVEFTPEQQRLADQMIRYRRRFAATGNPHGRLRILAGPAVTHDSDPYPEPAQPGARRARCRSYRLPVRSR